MKEFVLVIKEEDWCGECGFLNLKDCPFDSVFECIIGNPDDLSHFAKNNMKLKKK